MRKLLYQYEHLCSSRYNPVYEFQYTIGAQPCDMVFTSVSGHLMSLEFTGDARRWNGTDPVALYTAAVHKFVPEVRREKHVSAQIWSSTCIVGTIGCM